PRRLCLCPLPSRLPRGSLRRLLGIPPRHLTEKILTSRSALEGERKQVTVLFCDIGDSSRLVQVADPEVMYHIMDHVLGVMSEAVHRYEGTVNQYLGDGLMALFGAPVALEDHAFRAVQTALAIQETIGGYNAQLQRDYGVELHLHIGLNTGLVVVGRDWAVLCAPSGHTRCPMRQGPPGVGDVYSTFWQCHEFDGPFIIPLLLK